MLKLKNTVLYLFVAFVGLSSCSKEPSYDSDAQAKMDDQLIVDFIAKNKLTMQKHSSGIYYEIIEAGAGVGIVNSSKITANYKGTLLNGNVFDESTKGPLIFQLTNVIKGWQYGIPLVRKGGKIRLIIPSTLAYYNTSPGPGIPPNSILDFTISIVDVQ